MFHGFVHHLEVKRTFSFFDIPPSAPHGDHAHRIQKTKMLLKVVFDKTAFVSFKISNNL